MRGSRFPLGLITNGTWLRNLYLCGDFVLCIFEREKHLFNFFNIETYLCVPSAGASYGGPFFPRGGPLRDGPGGGHFEFLKFVRAEFTPGECTSPINSTHARTHKCELQGRREVHTHPNGSWIRLCFRCRGAETNLSWVGPACARGPRVASLLSWLPRNRRSAHLRWGKTYIRQIFICDAKRWLREDRKIDIINSFVVRYQYK